MGKRRSRSKHGKRTDWDGGIVKRLEPPPYKGGPQETCVECQELTLTRLSPVIGCSEQVCKNCLKSHVSFYEIAGNLIAPHYYSFIRRELRAR